MCLEGLYEKRGFSNFFWASAVSTNFYFWRQRHSLDLETGSLYKIRTMMREGRNDGIVIFHTGVCNKSPDVQSSIITIYHASVSGSQYVFGSQHGLTMRTVDAYMSSSTIRLYRTNDLCNSRGGDVLCPWTFAFVRKRVSISHSLC